MTTVAAEFHTGDIFDLSAEMNNLLLSVGSLIHFFLIFALGEFKDIWGKINFGLAAYELRLLLFVFQEMLIFEYFEFCCLASFCEIV